MIESLGSVQRLRRYPVKSMQGEEIEAADVTERGLLGDRAYALVDRETGRVASAKNPRKWGRLLGFQASFVEPPQLGKPLPPVAIALPDGARVSSEDGDLDRVLSKALGRDVALATTPPRRPSMEEVPPESPAAREALAPLALGAPRGTFFDFASLHLLTSSTLDRLGEAHPQSRFAVDRFRPNLVVDAPGTGFLENAWVGRTLAIGGALLAHVAIPCPRCVMTTLAQRELPADAGVLQTVALHNRVLVAPLGKKLPSVGVYAIVRRGGTIRRGDPLSFAPASLVQVGSFWLGLLRNALERKLRG